MRGRSICGPRHRPEIELSRTSTRASRARRNPRRGHKDVRSREVLNDLRPLKNPLRGHEVERARESTRTLRTLKSGPAPESCHRRILPPGNFGTLAKRAYLSGNSQLCGHQEGFRAPAGRVSLCANARFEPYNVGPKSNVRTRVHTLCGRSKTLAAAAKLSGPA